MEEIKKELEDSVVNGEQNENKELQEKGSKTKKLKIYSR